MNAPNIKENLLRIRERIALASERSGRRIEDVTLIAVSKSHPASNIRSAFEAGVVHFGENRVQEWEGKHSEVADLSGRWHLIGHLQSNKAARAARLFHSVDSVDSIALAERLDRAREEFAPPEKLRVLIEVNIASEESKSGAAIAELPALGERLLQLRNVHFAGLMCIPPYLEDIQAVRPYFAKLRELRAKLQSQLRHE